MAIVLPSNAVRVSHWALESDGAGSGGPMKGDAKVGAVENNKWLSNNCCGRHSADEALSGSGSDGTPEMPS